MNHKELQLKTIWLKLINSGCVVPTGQKNGANKLISTNM
jgi:hypothetical protein